MGSVCHGYMCIVLYMNFFGVMVFQTALLDCRRGVELICHRYMCIVLYISASRSAKFGVVVFKASLLESGGQSVIDPCYTITPPLPINHRSMLHHYPSPASQP